MGGFRHSLSPLLGIEWANLHRKTVGLRTPQPQTKTFILHCFYICYQLVPTLPTTFEKLNNLTCSLRCLLLYSWLRPDIKNELTFGSLLMTYLKTFCVQTHDSDINILWNGTVNWNYLEFNYTINLVT